MPTDPGIKKKSTLYTKSCQLNDLKKKLLKGETTKQKEIEMNQKIVWGCKHNFKDKKAMNK